MSETNKGSGRSVQIRNNIILHAEIVIIGVMLLNNYFTINQVREEQVRRTSNVYSMQMLRQDVEVLKLEIIELKEEIRDLQNNYRD